MQIAMPVLATNCVKHIDNAQKILCMSTSLYLESDRSPSGLPSSAVTLKTEVL